MKFTQPRALHATSEAVLSRATVRAADLLKVRQSELAAIVGVSPAIVSRVVAGGSFSKTGKTLELATLFVQLFRSLDAIVGGEAAVAATWLRQANAALGGLPIDNLKTVAGLTSTLAYLDARRALV
jgi:hypothetical protein